MTHAFDSSPRSRTSTFPHQRHLACWAYLKKEREGDDPRFNGEKWKGKKRRCAWPNHQRMCLSLGSEVDRHPTTASSRALLMLRRDLSCYGIGSCPRQPCAVRPLIPSIPSNQTPPFFLNSEPETRHVEETKSQARLMHCFTSRVFGLMP